MKLLTLNCHSWQEKEQLRKINYIAETIKENKYDVIAFQEVSQLIENEILYDNIKKDNFVYLLNENLKKLGCNDYEFFWDISHIGYDIYEEGLCILTRLPIVEKEGFFVTDNKDINNPRTRKIIKATLEYNGKYIDFYSCHLGWWNDEECSYKTQVDNLLKYNDKLSFYMGDFNNDPDKKDEGYDYLLRNLIDTYNLATKKDDGVTIKGKIDGWENNKKDMRIDLILSNQDVDVSYSNIIFNGKNKDIVSDHFGVEIEVFV